MEFKEVIARINFLYHKSQEEGLAEEEKAEQKKLKAYYIEVIKNNFRAQLDQVKKVNKDTDKN